MCRPVLRRSMIIPCALALAALISLVSARLLPFAPYWFAGDPWQHSQLLPDRTTAHLQIDLSRFTSDLQDLVEPELPADLFPDQLWEALPDFAGRYASVSLLPGPTLVAIIDVRNQRAARRMLEQADDPRMSLKYDKIIFAPDPASVEMVRDYGKELNLFSLDATRQYRHAILNRPEPEAPVLGRFFLRWIAAPAQWREDLSLLVSCDPDEYVTGTFSAEPHYRIDASCPALTGTNPPQEFLPEDPVPADAALYLHAAFVPVRDNVASLVPVLEIPALAQLLLLLESFPGAGAPAPEPDEGYGPPADSTEQLPASTLLDDLLAALDGSIAASVTQGRLTATLPHHDPEALDAFMTELERRGVNLDNLSHDRWQLRFDTRLAPPRPLPAIGERPYPPAVCPEGDRHVLVHADLPALAWLTNDYSSFSVARFCYVARRDDQNSHASIIITIGGYAVHQ